MITIFNISSVTFHEPYKNQWVSIFEYYNDTKESWTRYDTQNEFFFLLPLCSILKFKDER